MYLTTVPFLGEIRSGAQEHFYMETNSCLAIPSNEDGELTVYASTQNPTEGQKLIAHALNISMNKVVVKVKRLGGGFGGKETRCTPLIVAAAFAASKVNLPVKFSLDRDQVIFKCITILWDQTTKQRIPNLQKSFKTNSYYDFFVSITFVFFFNCSNL